MTGGIAYYIVVSIVRFFLFLWHPVFKVIGKDNIPQSGRLLICPNHSGAADPVWIVFALGYDHVPRIMAKKEVMKIPVIGAILKYFGVFGVDRDAADVNAVKTGLRCLNQEQQLLIFPEGTRMRNGQHGEAKKGAVTLATRTNSPILPVYLSTKRFPFSPLTCVIGEPYYPSIAGKKATDEELTRLSQELMDKIYSLEEHI